MAWYGRLPSLSATNAYASSANMAEVRQEAAERLEYRMAEVCKKYAQDFAGCSDIIDLQSGRVVIDNGHLDEMRNERDVGKRTRRLLGNYKQSKNSHDADDSADELSPSRKRTSRSEGGEGLGAQSTDMQLVRAAPTSIQSGQWNMITPETLTQLGQTIALQIAEALKMHQPVPTSLAHSAPERQRGINEAQASQPNYPTNTRSPSTPLRLQRKRLQLRREPSPLVWDRSLWAEAMETTEVDASRDNASRTDGFAARARATTPRKRQRETTSRLRDAEGETREAVHFSTALTPSNITRTSTPSSRGDDGIDKEPYQSRQKTVFSVEEDALIFKLRHEEELSFWDIQRYFPDKSHQCISNRYYHYLRPDAPRKKAGGTTAKRNPIMTLEDDEMVYELRHNQELTWADIIQQLGRSEFQVTHGYKRALARRENSGTATPVSASSVNGVEEQEVTSRFTEVPDSQDDFQQSSGIITPPDSTKTIAKDAGELTKAGESSAMQQSPIEGGVVRRSQRPKKRKHESLALHDLVGWEEDTETQPLERSRRNSIKAATPVARPSGLVNNSERRGDGEKASFAVLIPRPLHSDWRDMNYGQDVRLSAEASGTHSRMDIYEQKPQTLSFDNGLSTEKDSTKLNTIETRPISVAEESMTGDAHPDTSPTTGKSPNFKSIAKTYNTVWGMRKHRTSAPSKFAALFAEHAEEASKSEAYRWSKQAASAPAQKFTSTTAKLASLPNDEIRGEGVRVADRFQSQPVGSTVQHAHSQDDNPPTATLQGLMEDSSKDVTLEPIDSGFPIVNANDASLFSKQQDLSGNDNRELPVLENNTSRSLSSIDREDKLTTSKDTANGGELSAQQPDLVSRARPASTRKTPLGPAATALPPARLQKTTLAGAPTEKRAAKIALRSPASTGKTATTTAVSRVPAPYVENDSEDELA